MVSSSSTLETEFADPSAISCVSLRDLLRRGGSDTPIDSRSRNVVVDFTSIDVMTSAAWDTVNRLLPHVAARGGSVALVNINDSLADVLRQSDNWPFIIASSLDEARERIHDEQTLTAEDIRAIDATGVSLGDLIRDLEFR